MLDDIGHRESATKATIRYHITLIRIVTVKRQAISVIEKAEKLERSYTAGGNVKWFSYCGKVWGFLTKLNIEFL